jgi:hypothetical protein
VTDTATVALWRDSKDVSVARVVSSLEKMLGRPPGVAECGSLAAKLGVKLPPCPADARIYELRHAFASISAGGRLSLPIIGRLLDHTQVRTTARYAHLGDDRPSKVAPLKAAKLPPWFLLPPGHHGSHLSQTRHCNPTLE